MDTERYEDLKELFLRASEQPSDDRAAFLDRVCHDPDMRAQLERLLAEDSRDDARSFTARDTAELLSADFMKAAGEDPRTGLESMRIGNYHVVREIGRGAMGTVYEATQTSLGRRVALKVLPGSFARDARRVHRFQTEARATARLRHPNIIPVYEVGEESGTHYYAMEYIDGPSLDHVLNQLKQERSPQDEIATAAVSDHDYILRNVERVADLAEGLEKAHKLGLVHRDVKPSNVLVNPEGEFVLVDFGLVHDKDARITQTGERMGTLGYMAPEQLSFSQVDARADVYSLGVTLYEILTLKIPFDRPSLPELQKAILFEEPVAPRHLNPSINRDLDTIVQHALEKSPGRRYATAGAFATDLRRFLQHEPIQARPQTTITRMLRRTWKYRRLLGAAAILLLLVLTTSSLLYKHWAEVRQQNEVIYRDIVLGAIMKLPLGTTEPTEADEIWSDPVREATEELETASALFPGRPEGHYFRAIALHLRGSDEKARTALKLAIDTEGDFVPARALLDVIEDEEQDETGDATEQADRSDAERDWTSIWLRAHSAMVHKEWRAAARAYTLLIESRAGVLDSYLGLTVEAYLSRGRARLNAKDFDGAIEDFSAVKVLLPKMVEPVLLLAKTYIEKEKPARADELVWELYNRTEYSEDLAHRASSLFHDHDHYDRGRNWAEKMSSGRVRELRLSDLLRHEGELDEAIEKARKAVLSYPVSASARNNLGNCLGSADKIDEAIVEYRKAIALDPNYFSAYNNLGTALRKQKKLDDAIDAFETALELRPDFSQVHYNLGNMYRQTGEMSKAHDAYRNALRQNPSYALAWNNLGITLEALDRTPEAADAFLRSAHSRPSPFKAEALNNRGELLLKMGDLPAAIESLSQAIQEKPKYLSPHYLLANAYEERGDLNKAIETCETARQICEDQISEQPDNLGLKNRHVLVLEYVSRLLTALDKPKDARQQMKRALDSRRELANRTDVSANELRDVADALLNCPIKELRDPPEALEYARRAVELGDSKEPTSLGVSAQAYFDLGQTQAAVEACKKALAVLSEDSQGDSSVLREALENLLEECRKVLLDQQPVK